MRLLTILALALATTQGPGNIPPSTLTPDQIAAAIALGQSDKEIKTARIGKRATLVRSALAYENGRLLTAPVRIALAARAARTNYKTFTTDDVTPELGGDYLLVMLPPQRSSADERVKTAAETVLLLPKNSTDPAKAIRPLWTSSSLETLQNLFGAIWVEKTVFAAFPSGSFSADMELVTVYVEPTYFGGGPAKRELRTVIVDRIE